MAELRGALTPEMMQPVMALMNTDLGFRTDRDPNQIDSKTGKPFIPYSAEIVKECFIESKLRGFHCVGNEWNIIAGRFYACKNGFRRKVTHFAGVTDFKDLYEVPRLSGDKCAIVKCRAAWKKDGIADSIECEIPVKVNSFMGSDAILGKAERKLLKRVHDRLSGVITPEGEVGDDTPIDVQAKSDTTRPNFTPPAQPKLTTQDELANIVTGAGYNFDDFITWGRGTGTITDEQANRLTCFADVPDEMAERFAKAKVGLLRGLAATKGAA
jgi:hypothetical protein